MLITWRKEQVGCWIRGPADLLKLNSRLLLIKNKIITIAVGNKNTKVSKVMAQDTKLKITLWYSEWRFMARH